MFDVLGCYENLWDVKDAQVRARGEDSGRAFSTHQG